MRLSAYSIGLASLFALASLGACAEDDQFDDGNSDKQDDIVNYDKVTYGQAGPQQILLMGNPALMPIHPNVYVTEIEVEDEEGNVSMGEELTIKTPWVFHEYLKPINIWVKGKYDSPDGDDKSEDTRYGFHLEVLSNDNTEWIPMEAGPYDGWAWQYLSVKKSETEMNTYLLSGQTARYYDKDNAWFGGPIAEIETDFKVKAYGNDLEFRVAVIPMYSFWNWETQNSRFYGLDAILHNNCPGDSTGSHCLEDKEAPKP